MLPAHWNSNWSPSLRTWLYVKGDKAFPRGIKVTCVRVSSNSVSLILTTGKSLWGHRSYRHTGTCARNKEPGTLHSKEMCLNTLRLPILWFKTCSFHNGKKVHLFLFKPYQVWYFVTAGQADHGTMENLALLSHRANSIEAQPREFRFVSAGSFYAFLFMSRFFSFLVNHTKDKHKALEQ